MTEKTQVKRGATTAPACDSVTNVEKAKKEGLVQQTGPAQLYDVEQMKGRTKPQTPGTK